VSGGDPRARARELARAAVAEGRALDWFDDLYREAAAGTAVVPWDDRAPNPMLCRWLDRHPPPGPGARALDVGSGPGDNAAELARRGWTVTGFDVSAAAVEAAKVRVPDVTDWAVASLTAPPAAWRAAFDLVVEVYTLQVLPPAERAVAAAALAGLVAPGGTLVAIARAREPDEPAGALPWPLTRAEVEAIAGPGLRLGALDDVMDDEAPPVRRWVATFRAAAT
jgi:SAM-dependent methyltransferase